MKIAQTICMAPPYAALSFSLKMPIAFFEPTPR
jgi:hypothetical protein